MERGIITISENGAVTIPTVPVWMTQQEMSGVQRIRLRHPQGNPCHLQEYGVVGKRHHALRQAGQRDKL